MTPERRFAPDTNSKSRVTISAECVVLPHPNKRSNNGSRRRNCIRYRRRDVAARTGSDRENGRTIRGRRVDEGETVAASQRRAGVRVDLFTGCFIPLAIRLQRRWIDMIGDDSARLAGAQSRAEHFRGSSVKLALFGIIALRRRHRLRGGFCRIAPLKFSACGRTTA